ncbi:hypothetical protein [Nitrospira sp. Nam74]
MSADMSSCFVKELPVFCSRADKPTEHERPLVSTLLIYHKGQAYPEARWIPIPSIRRLLTKLGGYHQYRGNPRSLAYMNELIRCQMGTVDLVPRHDLSLLSQVSTFEQIVLLWPDANGMGWFDIERRVFNGRKAGSRVYVLNGRRRFFELPRKQWRLFRFKRFMEKTFLLEFVVLFLFLLTAPVMALWDSVSARMGELYD